MDERRPTEEFENAWREWAGRPPELDAREASRRIDARLDGGRRSWTRVRVLTAAAALVVIVVAGEVWRRAQPVPAPSIVVAEAPRASLNQGEVLIWLDTETPLYMNFDPPTQE